LGVGGKSRPVAREMFARNPEQGREQAAFGVIALALFPRQGGQHECIGHKRRLHECCVHPAQRGYLVRAVERACGKWSRRRFQRALDRSVATMQAARRLEALSERPEDHRENGAEGAMETADGIGKRVRVLLDCGGDPGMSELQQQRAARSQEGRGLSIDLPGDRPRTEYACERTGRRTAYQVQLALQVFRADDFERIMLCSRVHSCRLDTQLCGNREEASMSRYGADRPDASI